MLHTYLENQLYSNKIEHISYKGQCGIRVSMHSKEELLWAIDTQFQFVVM